jgi:hypothetical protein
MSVIIDIGGACVSQKSIPSTAVAGKGGLAISSGGCISSLSGILIGDVVDLRDANTYCNVYVAGLSLGSGPLVIGIQASDSVLSGTFTDPTSGLPQFPRGVTSGGFLIIGSGAWAAAGDVGGVFSSGVSGYMVTSGFMAIAAFQRPQRYVRLFVGSGFMDCAGLTGGFISQFKFVGSGPGFSYLPTSGIVNV